MLRLLFSISVFLIFHYASAQADFQLYTNGEDPTENYTPIYNFGGTGSYFERGFSEVADFNGDGFPDIVQDGNAINSAFWFNDGNGNYTEPVSATSGIQLPIRKLVADFDEDGDQDVLYSNGHFLYNDGNGNFDVVHDTIIEPKFRADLDFKQIDGQGGKEIITVNFTGWEKALNIYRRTSEGTYEDVLEFDLENFEFGTYHCTDADNDGDNDIILCGDLSETYEKTCRLYRNNGSGGFSQDTPLSFEGVSFGHIESADINGDGMMDLIFSGLFNDSENDEGKTKIFLGDADEEFSEWSDHGIIGTVNGGIEISDFNDDGELDILIGGHTSYDANLQTKLYLQSGGDFVEDSINSFPALTHPEFHRMDIDADGDQDLFMEGYGFAPYSRVYVNGGDGEFYTVSSDKHIANNYRGYMVDTQGDEKPELHFNGVGDHLQLENLSYTVTESGNLVESPNLLPFSSSRRSYFFDMEGDGDMDILSGSEFYRNGGDGSFTLDDVGEVTAYSNSRLFFVDLNNDGFTDIFGEQGYAYFNSAGSEFNPASTLFSQFATDYFPSDIDDDGDVDVISVAVSWSNIVEFYLNDGQGNFEIEEELSFSFGMNFNYEFPNTDFLLTADFDGDGDKDILVKKSGESSRLFRKEAAGFTQSQFVSGLRSAKMVDFDSDGDIDLFLYNEGAIYTYYNDGTGNFFEYGSDQFDFMNIRSLWIDDLEGDGDVDILYTGTDYKGRIASRLYFNETYALSSRNEVSAESELKVYPNPTTGEVRIRAEELIHSAEVYTVNGQKVFHTTPQVAQKQIDETLNLPNGLYILQVIFDNNNMATEKLIISN